MKGSVLAYYVAAWHQLVRHPHLIGVAVTFMIISMGSSVLVELFSQGGTRILLILLSHLITFTLSLGMILAFLRTARGEPSSLADLFQGPPYLIPALMGMGVVVLATLAGLVALILPGIYIGLRLQFVPFLIVDGWGPRDALRRSWTITRGKVLWLLGFNVVGSLLNLLGLLLFMVGMVISQPLTLMASTLLYQDLSQEVDGYGQS